MRKIINICSIYCNSLTKLWKKEIYPEGITKINLLTKNITKEE